MISKLPFGKTLTTVADSVPLRLFDWLVAMEPEKEFVLEALPPNPAKFLNIPVGPTSAPIVSVFPDEFVTALLEEKVSLKVTDKISPTFFALLSEEKRPAAKGQYHIARVGNGNLWNDVRGTRLVDFCDENAALGDHGIFWDCCHYEYRDPREVRGLDAVCVLLVFFFFAAIFFL